MFDTVSNAFVSDVYQNHRGFYLTLLHAFFGIGAFVGPLFSTVLINRGIKWNHVFLILGIVCALMIPLYIISIRKLPAKQEAAGTGKVESIFSLIVNPKLLILCLIMFLYFGYQSGISFWLPMYMEKGLNANPLLSSFALSAFWIGIIASRFLCSLLTKKYDAKYLILFGILLSGIVFILGIVINVPVVLLIASGVSGFFSGSTIPLLIMTGCHWYPKNSGTVSSMIFFFGTLSYIILPWLIGKFADAISFKWGMQLPGILLLIAAAFAFTTLRAKENIS
jgi:fucose permease